MDLHPRVDGTLLLLNMLDKVREGHQLEKTDMKKILSHPDIKQWLRAYGWIGNASTKFEKILRSLHAEPPSDLGQWGNKIVEGIRIAYENPEKMRDNLQYIQSYDWNVAVQKALAYLPENTKLEPMMIVTVDGFNGGMFRHDTVFLSLVFFDPSQVDMKTFAHEFHHMGVDYWWQNHPLIHKFMEEPKKEVKEYYFVKLFTYLVSEGMANAFCSPQAITKINGEGPWIAQHNEMITIYENRLDVLFNRLEQLLKQILQESKDDLSIPFERFTFDKDGRGIPPGHFLSGRMVQAMIDASSISQDQIIGLIKDPFNFLNLYNKAAKEENLRSFPRFLLQATEEFLAKLNA
ncbi:MAG: hypothetical protein GWO20_05805 [Candidatus Korarchaeota archaeon]|nr:hypothetical protein [Candidatus Korarchaeota archaeon]